MASVRKIENKSGFLADFGEKRILTHLGLFGFTLLGVIATYLYEPTSQLNDILAVSTGYVSLILLVVTLSIGTLNLTLKRKNPVNINFRRDVGIWCGVTGTFHGLISFTLYNSGNLIAYFLTKSANGSYSLDFNLSNFSNITGVLAGLIMLMLLLTSNNMSMRYLKGKSWKFLQRFNYPLFILVVVHTIGYLVLNMRESFFTFLLTALVIFTIMAQLIGIIITIQRENNQIKDTPANQPMKTLLPTDDELEQNRLARRRFLMLAGATLVVGVGSGAALAAAIGKENSNTATPTEANTNVTTGNPTNNNAAATVAPSNNTSVASGNSTGSTSNAPTSVASTGPAAGSTTSTTSVANSGNNTATATVVTISGTTIIKLSSLPVSSATTFTTPDTKETALVIHEQDGSVKAFSNVCTHRPYELVYQAGSQTLFCALHSANFDATTGAVLDGPPHTGLQSFNVHLDGQGNVVYSQA